jgi:hypothetical protein
MPGFVSVGGAWPFDLFRRKWAQLRFGRLKKSTNNNANQKDCNSDKGFFHGVYSPLYVTMMQWFRKGRRYRSSQS